VINKSIVIVGPTASGKTDLSIKLAKRIGSSIINTDSRLFYKNLDIGTGKPSKPQRSEIKHYLVDIIDSTDDFSISEFIKKATKSISQIITEDKVPILVGGSGQYTKALIEGWDIPEVPPDIELRKFLQEIIDNKGVEKNKTYSSEKIWIDMSKHRRPVINIKEIEPILKKHGFKQVIFEDLNILNKINLLQNLV